MDKKTKLKTIDLFAGMGGIRIGFEDEGFETVYANDYEPSCKKTYDLNFPNTELHVEDIRNVSIDDIPDFDLMLAGFPCQPFSVAGYRQGFEDKKGRGNLFFHMAKIIEEKQPMGFLLENVKNLEGHDKGKTFKIIKETLEELGYHIKARVLNTMEYGNLPQNRERIYIVGFKNKKIVDDFEWPKKIELNKKIHELFDKEVPEKYQYNNKSLYPKLKDDVNSENTLYQWRRHYVRENKKGVCPTLTANMGTGGHNVPLIKQGQIIRKLTPRECARFQGYPDSYILPELADSKLYKQVGNSVSITVIRRIAKNIRKAIEKNI
ncbi:MAG: DNA cytosine methyltransferase [Candidatus Pacebacteria bacterium]|nr:DNA cytosine methyltransferase [Candidatus Paceibacterota bacterium]